MLKYYPYASGSLYTSSFAATASFGGVASRYRLVETASSAEFVINATSGSRGKSVCLLTYQDYLSILNQSSSGEFCDFGDG